MTKVYKLTTIDTTTEATKEFFENNKFFFVKSLNNGHFEFVGSNREVLETSTCQQFNKEATGDIVITTRNSIIQIAPIKGHTVANRLGITCIGQSRYIFGTSPF